MSTFDHYIKINGKPILLLAGQAGTEFLWGAGHKNQNAMI